MRILAIVMAFALIAADEPKVPDLKLKAQEDWHLTLPEAVRIGLENAPVVRVIAQGAPGNRAGEFEPTPLNPIVKSPRANRSEVVVARLDADASAWKFKGDLMAQVRSIEQQYWTLANRSVTVWSRQTAVKLGGEILARARARLAEGRATRAEVAEAEQQVDNDALSLAVATADLMTTERQLRNILGLPVDDGRRIVLDTAPRETEVNPDWEACVATMLGSQPDIARSRQDLGFARLKALVEAEDPALTADRKQASTRQLEVQQAAFQQVVHQATHSLARFFLEIDANYKQFKIAMKLREAAQKRLEAQRVSYEDGKITVDRLLDAVTQYANAIAQESLFKSSYNTSIAAFEEAQGTLLSCYGITIATQAGPLKPAAQPVQDDRVAPVSFKAPVAPPVPAAPSSLAPAQAPAASTTYKLKAKFGLMKILDVELEVCPSPK